MACRVRDLVTLPALVRLQALAQDGPISKLEMATTGFNRADPHEFLE